MFDLRPLYTRLVIGTLATLAIAALAGLVTWRLLSWVFSKGACTC